MSEANHSHAPAYRILKTEKMTLSVAEAAAVLGVSRSLVYRMIQSGEIPSLRLSSRILIPKNRLIEMIEKTHDGEVASSTTITF